MILNFPGPYVQTGLSDQSKGGDVREVQASDAKVQLLQLLDDVEWGETIIITRHGRPIARIVPEAPRRQEEIDRAIDTIKELQKRTGKITDVDLLTGRHAGHTC
jgi:prevent-host-death family protein